MTIDETICFKPSHSSLAKISIHINIAHFTIKTAETLDELVGSYSLRSEVFQIEMMGHNEVQGLDIDSYDAYADHLVIVDNRNRSIIATCRLTCSIFTKNFYSSQEFYYESLIARPETKIELGRVCVRPDSRRGATLLMLWRGIGEYMVKTGAEILFGCGSVMTEDPKDAALIYHYLKSEGRLNPIPNFEVTPKYRFPEFEKFFAERTEISLTLPETERAKNLIPSLCLSYFEMGCYIAGEPALDRDFKCIDFLTLLEKRNLDWRLRRRLLGETS